MKIENLLSLTVPNPNPSASPITVAGPPNVPTTSELILNIPQFLLTVIVVAGMVLAIVFIILSGIQWIASGGDEKKIEGARKRLTYSIIGLVVVLASFAIVSFVSQLLVGPPQASVPNGVGGDYSAGPGTSPSTTI